MADKKKYGARVSSARNGPYFDGRADSGTGKSGRGVKTISTSSITVDGGPPTQGGRSMIGRANASGAPSSPRKPVSSLSGAKKKRAFKAGNQLAPRGDVGGGRDYASGNMKVSTQSVSGLVATPDRLVRSNHGKGGKAASANSVQKPALSAKWKRRMGFKPSLKGLGGGGLDLRLTMKKPFEPLD